MSWVFINACVFLLNVCVTAVVISKIQLIAFRKRLFDVPDERKIHTHPIPRLGGIAFCPVVMFSLTLLIGVTAWSEKIGVLMRFYPYLTEVSLLASSSITLYLVGMCDDLIGVRYGTKFFVQMLCGVMLVLSGLWIMQFDGFLGIETIPVWLGIPLTILVVIFIINAINLIDGIDGLASGLCGLALLYYSIVFYGEKNFVYSVISVAALGTLVPFFYFNVFGEAEKGKKIFMGDTGSLTIGILICFLSIKLCSPMSSLRNSEYNPLVVAFAPLMIPCLDVIRVFGNRIAHKKNPFLPDKTHIHHKLLAIGLSQGKILVTILLLSLFCTISSVLLSKYLNVTFVLLICVLFYILLNVCLNGIGRRKRSLLNICAE
ncbi:MAG: undecaprenyl/decaprenyl-phosphate alpha-N-acetylglucosaminyl 1-phosphate transferase [Bacteroidales bacterium]|nr:undecaprenyl/decaprenyl-phosphate alpha-N-acetylglucosaminyl 1-phosphate transferase [Bacteroidales bacterium]